MTQNKKIISILGLTIGTTALLVIGTLSAAFFYVNPIEGSPQNALFIPPLIDSAEENHDISLTIQNSTHEFYPGVESKTKGFSQSYLGPTIRLYDGKETRIRFTNEIGEPTTVHGHGLHVPGSVDGGPQNGIAPDETWDITLPIEQQASTNWYHPHLMGKTAEHVHSGLAGMYIIEDDNSATLDLPKEYGVNDIPLVIQDRSFSDGVMNEYSVTEDEMMNGKREDALVVNGTVSSYVEVPQGWVRLRLLNGSNARYYNFHLKNNEPFYKIATEGGFLEEPVEITELQMTPGERNEILVDMSDGKNRSLMADMIPVNDSVFEFLIPTKRVVELRTDSTMESTGKFVNQLNTITPLLEKDAAVMREFELQMEHDGMVSMQDMNGMHSMFAINGKSMDINRIDEEIQLGDIEIWKITADEMDHPFHLHGTSFLILSQNGRAPAPADRGWKDTVNVGWGATEIIMKFEHEASEEYPYMYHCHILEHEDGGMMGQFTVTQ
jgi:bilirubin oxidase